MVPGREGVARHRFAGESQKAFCWTCEIRLEQSGGNHFFLLRLRQKPCEIETFFHVGVLHGLALRIVSVFAIGRHEQLRFLPSSRCVRQWAYAMEYGNCGAASAMSGT